MSFLFEGRKGFILLNDNKVIRLDEKRKCCVTKVIRFEMVVERKVLINIVGRGFVCAKGFRKKKKGVFARREKGEKVNEGESRDGKVSDYSDFHGCQMKVNVVAEDTNHGCNQTDRLTHSGVSTGVRKSLLVNLCVLPVLV